MRTLLIVFGTQDYEIIAYDFFHDLSKNTTTVPGYKRYRPTMTTLFKWLYCPSLKTEYTMNVKIVKKKKKLQMSTYILHIYIM